MHQLSQAITALDELLCSLSTLPSQLSISFQWDENINPLAWFEAQTLYPKFYWRSRDGQEDVFVLGQLLTFSDPYAAEAMLKEKQRVWGGIRFRTEEKNGENHENGFFFLPKIEIQNQRGKWTLKINLAHSVQATRVALSELQTSFHDLCANSYAIQQIEHEPDYETWCALVNQALTSISQRDFQKVVLARKTRLKLNETLKPMLLLQKSQQQNHDCYHFMLAMNEKDCFLGSTPERLLLRQGQTLMTEALAGTARRGENGELDSLLECWLLQDNKNNIENQLVVDDIFSRLNSICSFVRVERVPHVIKLRQVQHLKRSISACLHQNIRDSHLLKTLHPTAAIAGYPRNNALDFIVEKETFKRGWYSGSVGYFSREKSEFCVSIRSAYLMDKSIDLYAGAGIVEGSEPEAEWQELNRKTATLQSFFAHQKKQKSKDDLQEV